jgi:leucyl-tRNA synthetase
MAYYTIAHFLQGDLNGTKPGLLGIKASDLNDEVWDYVFLRKEYKTLAIPERKLAKLRESFEYWYPMDLRCSGKDLIKNHLTMSLFVHAAIWENQPEKWPRGFYCNGWVLVDGKKMSKSVGNFKQISDVCRDYGADASRMACASSGDTLDDANFTTENVNAAILQLSTIEMYYAKVAEHFKSYR